MAQIKTKFIENSAVTAAKLATDSVTTAKILDANVTNSKIATGIDASKIADGSVSNAEFQRLDGVTSSIQTQLDSKIDSSEKGANNGVATLDAGGKIPASQLPSSVMEYKGNWNASTNSPTLADGTGDAGDVYRVNVAGTQNLGSGSQTFAIGDWVVYNGTIWQKSANSDSVVSVNGQTGVVVLDTDDIAEAANLYFTDERAQDAVGSALTDSSSVDLTYNDGANTITAAVIPGGVDHDALLNYVADEHVDHTAVQISTPANSGLSGGGTIAATRTLSIDPTNAPTVTAAANDLILIADASDSNNLKKVLVSSINANASPNSKFTKVLSAGDITNQYFDFPLATDIAKVDSVNVSISGVMQYEGVDYTLNYTGGGSGQTRLTFAGDLATGGAAELVFGDTLYIQFEL